MGGRTNHNPDQNFYFGFRSADGFPKTFRSKISTKACYETSLVASVQNGTQDVFTTHRVLADANLFALNCLICRKPGPAGSGPPI
jgi:hypothetical protein